MAEVEFLSDVSKLPEPQRRIAYLEFLKRSNRSDTLSNRISAGVSLNKWEIDALVALFGKHCQGKKKRKLRSTLECGLSYNVSSYDRVIFDIVDTNCPVEYVAGQSYPDEIRRVRETMIKKG